MAYHTRRTAPNRSAAHFAVGQVVLDLQHGRALGSDRGLVVLSRFLRLAQGHPEMGGGDAARLEIRGAVTVFQEGLLLDVAEQISRDGPGPDTLDFRLPA